MTDGIIGLGAQGTRPLLGNSQLRPETSTSSELGVVYDDGAGLTGNLTAFHTRFKDKLDNQNVANCRASAPFRVAWTWACGAQRRAGGQFLAARECGFGDHQGFSSWAAACRCSRAGRSTPTTR